jgi:hypothetical protein
MILGYKYRTNLAPWLKPAPVADFADLEAEHAQLCEWLRAATKGLVASAKERIRMEIETHYTEAVAAHVADGLSETDAKMAAVAKLGDARAAAKRFRKEHLTAEEADAAASYLKWARNLWVLLGMYLFFCFTLYMDRDLVHAKHYLTSSASFMVGFLTLVVIPTACFVVVRCKNSKPNMTLIVLVQSGAFFAWVICFFFNTHGPGIWSFLYGLMYACVLLIRPLRLWKKLRRAGDDWREMPPRNAASS